MKIGFDSNKYLQSQYEHILKKIDQMDGKLYMEFGGKIFDDLHASRVLPGFQPNIKIQLLKKLKADSEIIVVVSAEALQKNKIRADFNITYGDEVLRLIDNLRAENLTVSAIVITMFNGQNSAKTFGNKLERRNEKVYYHSYTKGYPDDVDMVVSDEGYGKNTFIKTTKKLVVITAPGPNSGKLATALSQLYHEYKNGNRAGYAKYETFPVWNLPTTHPLNIAYEAATADLGDVNMIDNYHKNAYGIQATNYNRDIEAYPLLNRIITKITGNNCIYKSPTDMGVNMISAAIIDDEEICKASRQEIIRRYYRSLCDYKRGNTDITVCERIKSLMDDLKITPIERPVVNYAIKRKEETNSHIFAIELPNGEMISGRTKTLTACTAAILNAIKKLAQIEEDYELIPKSILTPILTLNKKILNNHTELLELKDILIALSVSATTNNKAKKALETLKEFKGLQAHSTYILSQADEITIKKLGLLLTSEPCFLNNNLFE